VSDVSFTLHGGELLGLVGPNGAGKSALLNCVNGVIPAQHGDIRLDGRSIVRARADVIARAGVGRSFQTMEHFRDFKAIDFVMLAGLDNQAKSLAMTSLGLPGARRSEARARAAAHRALAEFDLASYEGERLAELPYGIQKRIDIVRAIASDPRVVLLDEPTSGVSADEIPAMRSLLERLGQRGTAALVVDHDVAFIRSVCNRVVVMASGRVMAIGPPADVFSRHDVKAEFLGSSAADYDRQPPS